MGSACGTAARWQQHKPCRLAKHEAGAAYERFLRTTETAVRQDGYSSTVSLGIDIAASAAA